MEGYRELEIFKKAYALGIRIHAMSLKVPKFELYEEGSQIRRSSKATAVMITEGYNRRIYKADFIKYLVYAHAECDETIVHLDFLFETRSFTDEVEYTDLRKNYESLGRQINGFSDWVKRQAPKKRPK